MKLLSLNTFVWFFTSLAIVVDQPNIKLSFSISLAHIYTAPSPPSPNDPVNFTCNRLTMYFNKFNSRAKKCLVQHYCTGIPAVSQNSCIESPVKACNRITWATICIIHSPPLVSYRCRLCWLYLTEELHCLTNSEWTLPRNGCDPHCWGNSFNSALWLNATDCKFKKMLQIIIIVTVVSYTNNLVLETLARKEWRSSLDLPKF